jgi:hypothetical protein
MATDPFLRVSLDGAEVVFILGAEQDPETVENVDVEVRLADESRWSATFVSLAEIGRIMDRWTTTGEGLRGRYFQCADLVIVREGGVPAMVEVVRGLLDADDLRMVFVRLDEISE